MTLLQRYKELGVGGGSGGESIPFDIDSHITEIDTGKIDADYMNSRFEKYLKVLQSGDEQAKETTLAELHRSFSSLAQEEQRIAEIFLHDIQRGDVQIDPHRTFREYLTDYQDKAKNQKIAALVALLGVDKAKLIALINTHVTDANLNEYGRFDDLRETVDQQKAKAYFESVDGQSIPLFRVNIRTANLLQKFIIEDGFDLELFNQSNTPIEKFLHEQLGEALPWKAISQTIINTIKESPEKCLKLSEINKLAESVRCSPDEVFSVINLLSHPEKGLLQRRYWHIAGNTATAVPQAEVTQRLTEWWRDKSISDDEWKAWAANVELSWSMNEPFKVVS